MIANPKRSSQVAQNAWSHDAIKLRPVSCLSLVAPLGRNAPGKLARLEGVKRRMPSADTKKPRPLQAAIV